MRDQLDGFSEADLEGLPDLVREHKPNALNARDRSRIPLHLFNALIRYAGPHRRGTGHFLRSCLENDFVEACTRAHADAEAALPAIAAFIFNELPGPCWGSKAKVERWLKRREHETSPEAD